MKDAYCAGEAAGLGVKESATMRDTTGGSRFITVGKFWRSDNPFLPTVFAWKNLHMKAGADYDNGCRRRRSLIDN